MEWRKKMKTYKLDNMIRGWFVGDFESAFRTKDCEVAVMRYKAGDKDKKHYHKVATELTVVVKGKVMINGKEYCEGEIIVMEPGDVSEFQALTDAIDVVVKMPSVVGDKYVVD